MRIVKNVQIRFQSELIRIQNIIRIRKLIRNPNSSNPIRIRIQSELSEIRSDSSESDPNSKLPTPRGHDLHLIFLKTLIIKYDLHLIFFKTLIIKKFEN